MLKIGIAGCGSIAKIHLAALESLDDIEVQAVVDTDLERAKICRDTYGNSDIHLYTSFMKMLEQEQLDVVHICTPHYLHVPMAIEALKRGIHVFMEKPQAVSREEFEKLKEMKRKCQKEVGICFQNRYNPAVRKIKEILETGCLGEPTGARTFLTWNREKPYYEDSGWRGSWKTEGGGVLINQAVHTLDLLVYLLGKPEIAEASFQNHHLKSVIEVEDTMEAYMEVKGSPVCFYATNGYAEDSPVFLEILCLHGKIRMEGEYLEICLEDKGREVYDFSMGRKQLGKSCWGNSHFVCIKDFYTCLQEKRIFSNSLELTEDTFQLMMGLYDSAKNNCVFRLEEKETCKK